MVNIELSWRVFFKIFLFILFLIFIWEVRNIILILITSMIFSAGIEVWARFLANKIKIPYFLSVVLIFLGIFGFLSIIFYFLTPIFLGELKSAIPTILNLNKKEIILSYPFLKEIIENFQDKIGFYLANLKNLTLNLLGGAINLFLIVVISFYLSIQGRNVLGSFLNYFLPDIWIRRIIILWEISQLKFAQWFMAEIILMIIVGFLAFIGFSIVGVPHSGLLGILSGVLEIVPFIGPTISAFAAGVIGLSEGIKTGILAVLVMIIIQQLENHVIVPNLMKQKINMNPVIVILSLMIGAKIAGIIGVLISIPFVGALIEILSFLKSQGYSLENIVKKEEN